MIGALACATACAVDDGGSSAATDEAADPSREIEAPEAAVTTPYDCPSGDICFYDATGGTGNRCNWSVSDPDWTSGQAKCSWAQTRNVKSVYNHADWSVSYFLQKNFQSKIGSTQPGVKGNLTGTYKLLSHQFNCSPINKLFGCQ
jgi:hypothetical protein